MNSIPSGRLRIGVIGSADHPIQEPFAGGLEAQTHALATSLRARGHSVTLFASDESDPATATVPILSGRPIRFSNRALEDPSMLALPFLERHHAYLDLMLHLRESDFDVIQNSSLHYLPVAMASAINRPLVTTLHTPPTPWLESAISSNSNRARDTIFVSVSEANARTWEGITIREVIPNGVDTESWQFHSAPDRTYAVWTGRFVPEKGPHLAIEAAHRAGLDLILAGPMADETYFYDEVRPRLRPSDEYAGHLETSELSEIVGKASVTLVTPCWEEPFGLVVIESLSCGTPVVAFDRGAVREILGGVFDDYIIPPGDIEGMASRAREALDCDRSRCREIVETRYSIERMVTRYEDLYLRICEH